LLLLENPPLLEHVGGLFVPHGMVDNLQRINGSEAAERREEWYMPWGDPPDVYSLG